MFLNWIHQMFAWTPGTPATWVPSWLTWGDPDILRKGIVILVGYGIYSFIAGFLRGRRMRRTHSSGWDEVWREPIKQRIWRRLSGQRGVTTIERRPPQ
jgi:hypothetical protein